MKNFKKLTSIVFITSIFFLFSGCQGYKVYNHEEGDIHFSFEYPDFFTDFHSETLTKYSAVECSRSTGNDDYKDLWFGITLNKIPYIVNEKVYYSAVDYLDQYIETSVKNGEEVERSELTILGVTGEQAVSSFTMYPDYYDAEGGIQEPTEMIAKLVSFDYGGYIWRISMWFPKESSNVDIQYFDHIIKSLTILD